MYKIYGPPVSRATRVSWLCEELGLDYEFKSISPIKGEAQTKEFLALNPAGKIPVLQDGDLIINESAAICIYLADKHSDAKLIPTLGSPERAQHDALCWFLVTDLESPLWTITKHTFVYPEDRRVNDIIDISLEEWIRSLNAFATMFKSGPFAIGDSFTVADVLAGHILRWAINTKKCPVEHDGLLAYASQLSERPALRRALAHAS